VSDEQVVVDLQTSASNGDSTPDAAARYLETDDGLLALQHIVDQIGLSLAYAQALEAARAHIGALARILQREQRDAWQEGLSQGSWAYVYDGVDVRREVTESRDVTVPVDSSRAQGAEAVTADDLALPLGPPDEPLGYVRMTARSGRPMQAADITLARAISDEAGEALLRAQMHERTRSTLGETDLLYRCSRAIVQAQTPDDILASIVEHMEGFGGGRQGPLDRAWLLIPDLRSSDPFSNLRIAAVFGADRHPDQVWSNDRLPILGQEAPVVVQDVSEAETLDGVSRETLTQAFGLRAAWLFPLVVLEASGDCAGKEHRHAGKEQRGIGSNHHVVDEVGRSGDGGERVGWLVVGSSTQPYGFPEQEQRFVHHIADVAAIMLRHLEYLAQAAQRARRAQLVGSISTRVRQTLDMDLMLQTALREIGENLGISSIEVQMQRQAGAESVDDPDEMEQAP
jgi:GAF domain-containing protein